MAVDLNNYSCSHIGLLLPAINEYTWSTGVRAFLYLAGMIWCFLGVAIISDIFMCSIERITSKTRVVKIADSEAKDGYQEIEVKVWNDTVANLSLMALGTSAPEILLNVVEIFKNNFVAKELGPGTIVGSAAFNLLCITAVCIVSIPNGDVRKIAAIRVYGVTSFFCIFSYVWLILVIMVISEGVVELWEAIVTFLLFPVLIIVAYLADKVPCSRKNKTDVSLEIGLELPSQNVNVTRRRSTVFSGSAEIIELAKELGRRPDITEEDAAMLAAAKVSEQRPHTSNWYRINATRMLMGGPKIQPKVNEKLKTVYNSLQPIGSRLGHMTSRASLSGVDISEGGIKTIVEFTSASCAVLENEGKVRIGIRRYGNLAHAIAVKVETIDGTAEAGSDYKPVKEVIKFAAKERLKEIYIDIVDDDIWEPDEFFFVKLSTDGDQNVVLGKTSINQITIVNDDEPGKFEFTKPSYLVKESSGKCMVTVQRVNGADGKVFISWKTADMSAENGKDYGGGEGELTFEHGETSKEIDIPIYTSELPERDQNFQIELFKPTDGAQLGRISRTIVTIVNDEEFNGMVERIANLAVKNLDTLKLDTASWLEQFRCALNVNGGDLDSAGFFDYLMHFCTFFWKVVFAFVPPPSYAGGWLTFCLSLGLIGFLTVIIGDLASIFGCLLNVPESITAITFVALGTSMPDTFASRSAAMNEKTADSSIGNINGSNSVNVFLGLGLPWMIASIYWQAKGQLFYVPSGSLGFSVVLYTCAAVIAMSVLMLRSKLKIFGCAELGGPKTPKIASALLIFSMWVAYIILSSLAATDIIHVPF